jgi:hypothetical protein
MPSAPGTDPRARANAAQRLAITALLALVGIALAAAGVQAAKVHILSSHVGAAASIRLQAANGRKSDEGSADDSLSWFSIFNLTVNNPVPPGGGGNALCFPNLSTQGQITGGGQFGVTLGAPGTGTYDYSATVLFEVTRGRADWQASYQAYTNRGLAGSGSYVWHNPFHNTDNIPWSRMGQMITADFASGTLDPGRYKWRLHTQLVAPSPGDGGVATSTFLLLDQEGSVAFSRRPRGRIVHTHSAYASALAASVTLDATATAPYPLSYQWRRNGAPLSNGGSVSGADGPLLTLSSFDASWNGLYDCTAWDLDDTLTTYPAVLEADVVSSVPLLLEQPESEVADSSGIVEFTVDAESSGPIMYQWLFNGQPLADGPLPSGAEVSGSQSSYLRISQPTADEQGSYTCQLTNDFGSVVTQPAQLGPPVTAVGPSGAGRLAFASAPNPARHDATLSFVTPREGPVKVGIFDVTGRRVATLHDSSLEAGPHQLRWDLRGESGHRVTAGVYLAKLETAGGDRAVRIVVLP